MYNIQEPNAWVGYIADLWEKKKDTKWVTHLLKLLKKYDQQENVLTKSSKSKAYWLIVEMIAYKKQDKSIAYESVPKN